MPSGSAYQPTKRYPSIEKVNHYDLNQDEARLLDGYRNLTDSEKESIQLVIDNYNKKENSDS